MRSVWKFPFTPAGECEVMATDSFEVALVALDPQTKEPAIWIDDQRSGRSPDYPRRFKIFGTGHEVPDQAVHVGSVIQQAMVWHVYKVQG